MRHHHVPELTPKQLDTLLNGLTVHERATQEKDMGKMKEMAMDIEDGMSYAHTFKMEDAPGMNRGLGVYQPMNTPYPVSDPFPVVDLINHPPHYTQHPSGVECIQITEHMGFNTGNALKYVWRADLKHDCPLADLNKAKWYIEREIALRSKGDG